MLRPAFRLAYEDDFIRKNPFDFELASVLVNDSVIRQALTRKRKDYFLSLSAKIRIIKECMKVFIFYLILDFAFLSL